MAAMTMLVAACGAEPDLGASGNPADSSVPPSSPVTTSPPDGPIVVVAQGTLLADGDRLRLCPPRHLEHCPYIDIEGDIDPSFVSDPSRADEASVVRLTGTYNGRSMQLTAPPEFVESTEPDFTTPCEEKRRGGGSGNPSPELPETIAQYEEEHPDSFAIWWWDRDNAVANVWFKGEAEGHRGALEQLIDPDSLCVIGGATYSAAELRSTSDAFFDAYNRNELPIQVSSGSAGSLANRVIVSVEAIDAATAQMLVNRFGPALQFDPLIEVIQGSLANLPGYVPVGPSDIPILTSNTRTGGGMQALGRFVLGFDEGRGCFFLGDDEERVLPVWPFGYSAGLDPLAIYGPDGSVVLVPGELFESGGGFVDLVHVPHDEDCGASGAWIFSSRPTVIVEG